MTASTRHPGASDEGPFPSRNPPRQGDTVAGPCGREPLLPVGATFVRLNR